MRAEDIVAFETESGEDQDSCRARRVCERCVREENGNAHYEVGV